MSAPTYSLAQRSTSGDLHRLLRPVPPAVAEALGEPAAKHAKLAERYGAATATVIATKRALEDAQRADATSAAKALSAGQAIPKAKAPKIEDELREAEREVAAIEGVIGPSALDLLSAASEIASDVSASASAAADEAEQRAIELLAAAGEALAESGELRQQSAWLTTLDEDGIVPPWTSRPSSTQAALAIADAVRRVADGRERRAEYVVERERETIALNSVPIEGGFKTLPPPPTREQLEAERATR